MKQNWKKTDDELNRLRNSGREMAKIVDRLALEVKPGISTWEIDELAEKWITEIGGIPIFKGYGHGMPFPATICASINEEVVHGIPSRDRILKEGDLFKMDIGMRYEGMVSDMARTFAVGQVSDEAMKLLVATRESLDAGIAMLRPGSKMIDYARAVEGRVKRDGFLPVRDLVGHGVGRELHEEPQIANYVTKSVPGFTFIEGMAVALEPMINVGGWEVKLGDDQWTFVTADGSLSAHFEDSVIITKEGCEIVTRL
jgi:methionyl aminopeptidase